MKILVVENEPLSAERLITLIRKLDNDISVEGTTDSVSSTVKWLEANPDPDLIFLDIHLADGLCFDIFNEVKVNSPVIFTTAYDEYALRAFKLNSIDYLLKPLEEQELERSYLKYKGFFRETVSSNSQETFRDIRIALKKNYKTRFLIKIGGAIKSIPVEEVAYFIAEERMNYLFTWQRVRLPMDRTLDQLEELIDPGQFYRLNRKIIAHYKSIVRVSSYFNSRLKVELNPPLEDMGILVSREKVAEFKKWLGQ
jgi:two-component system, LytTR family, response regulator LytT